MRLHRLTGPTKSACLARKGAGESLCKQRAVIGAGLQEDYSGLSGGASWRESRQETG